MYTVPVAGAWWHAVGAQLERGVRLHGHCRDDAAPCAPPLFLGCGDGTGEFDGLMRGTDIGVDCGLCTPMRTMRLPMPLDGLLKSLNCDRVAFLAD
jgi:hypothetical protein